MARGADLGGGGSRSGGGGMVTLSFLVIKANLGANDNVGWSTELARLRVVVPVDSDVGEIPCCTAGGSGTGLVGFGGRSDTCSDFATDSRTGTDEDDDDACAGPAGVVPSGIVIAVLSRVT